MAHLAAHRRGPAGDVPLVLLHAFPLDATMWEPVVELLDVPTLCLDLPGFGGSPGSRELAHEHRRRVAPSIDNAAAEVLEALDAEGIERAVVAGLSMGGYGALKCALRAGDVFSRGASLSGAADIRQLPPGGYWEDVFGPREQIPGSFNDLFAAAKALPPENRPPLYMWCGTEDSLLPGNHALRDHLLALGYDLTYAESAGNHAWQWWDLHIQDVLRWLFPQTEVK